MSRPCRHTIPILLLLLLTFPSAVLAHPGHAFAGVGEGLAHPLTGWDHLLALLGVGMLTSRFGGRAGWIIPSVFLGAMLAGLGLGMKEVPLPGVEQGIIASVFIFGLLIALARCPRLWLTLVIVAAFAVFHGYAHATELPTGEGGFGYGLGLVFATAILQAVGFGLASMLNRPARPMPWLRLAGGGLVAAGLARGIL